MTVYATLIRMTAEEITGMTNAQKALNDAFRVGFGLFYIVESDNSRK